jgi:hypothetical protein
MLLLLVVFLEEESSFFTAFAFAFTFIFGFAFPFAFVASDFFFPPALPLLPVEGDLEDFEVVRLFLFCFVGGFVDGFGFGCVFCGCVATAWTAALLPLDADALLFRRWCC